VAAPQADSADYAIGSLQRVNTVHAGPRTPEPVAGTDLASDPAASVYLEQYAHGGMSSGMISLEAWRQRLMPMLVERARTRLPGWPWITDPDQRIL